MKAVSFKQQTVIIAENQNPYLPLPVVFITGKEGHVISCWKLSFKERLKILITGRLWHSQMTFCKPPMPIFMSIDRKKCFIHPDDKDYKIQLAKIEKDNE